jgi:hypothetical protein
MSDDDDLFGEALQDLRFREDLGFGPFNEVSSKQRALRFPDFLIIGAQKAGTTWLHANLDYHPNIWLAPVKELNYFNQVYSPSADYWEARGRDTQAREALAFYESHSKLSARWRLKRAALDVIAENSPTDDWYGRIFAHAPAEDLCGEASPEYCVLPRGAIAHIVSLNPTLKAILVVRDPIDRFWSHARMAQRDGYGETSLDYLSNEYNWRIFAGRSNYCEMIRRWRSCLSEERIIILNYDWIVADPLRVLSTVCERLGIRHDTRFFPHAETSFGAGQELVIPDDLYALAKARMRHIYDELMELMPEIAEPWTLRHYQPSLANWPGDRASTPVE